MNQVKYVVESVKTMYSIIEELNLGKKERSMTLTELSQKIARREVSFVFQKINNTILIKIDYELNDIEEIDSDIKNAIIAYIKDKSKFNKFKYKINITNKEDRAFLINFAESKGFELEQDSIEVNRNSYFNIGTYEVFDGKRHVYSLSSDDYLFHRGDDFFKVNIEYFKKIIKLLDFLEIKIGA